MERQTADLPPASPIAWSRYLDSVLNEGDPLPSVRNVAAEYRVNPLTVLKGYQQLVNENFVESRRGLGMFLQDGRAQSSCLLQGERQKFLAEEWPQIQANIQRLGLTPEDLLKRAATARIEVRQRGAENDGIVEEHQAAQGVRKAWRCGSIDMCVEEGPRLGIIGPNSTGKTTTSTRFWGSVQVLGRIARSRPGSVARAGPLYARRFFHRRCCCRAGYRVWQALDYVAGVHPRDSTARKRKASSPRPPRSARPATCRSI